MTRHPINAFFRRGKPIPLTGNDFTFRFDGGEDYLARKEAMAHLRENGFIRETEVLGARVYQLTDAGIGYARAVLCIRGEMGA